MWKNWLIGLGLSLTLFGVWGGVGLSWAKPKFSTIRSQGVASIEKKWTPQVRQKALRDAFRKALWLSIWRLMGDSQKSKTRGRLMRFVQRNAPQFVSGFRVVSEEISTHLHEISLEVFVDKAGALFALQRMSWWVKAHAHPAKKAPPHRNPSASVKKSNKKRTRRL